MCSRGLLISHTLCGEFVFQKLLHRNTVRIPNQNFHIAFRLFRSIFGPFRSPLAPSFHFCGVIVVVIVVIAVVIIVVIVVVAVVIFSFPAHLEFSEIQTRNRR